MLEIMQTLTHVVKLANVSKGEKLLPVRNCNIAISNFLAGLSQDTVMFWWE